MSLFDEVIARQGTRSIKWSRMEQVYGMDDASDILPMWIADMDFAAPPAVIDAMQKRLDQRIFGYSYICDSCLKAIVDWNKTRYNWTISSSHILFHHGVVPAIASVMELFTNKGDKIAMSTPVYPPFFTVTAGMEREVVGVPLLEKEGYYTYDFNLLEQAFQQGVALYILCNPHNPGGRVWQQDELRQLLALCERYDVLLLSDEIHGDITFKTTYTPILSLREAKGARVITTIAPTKTFNLAGVQAAMLITEHPDLHAKLKHYLDLHGHSHLNAFSASAVQAAYTDGHDWLKDMLLYVSRNMDYVVYELSTIPGIHVQKPEGTYLLWIDYRQTGLTEDDVMQKLLTIGKLALDPGTKFHEEGRGFLRMNIACPFTTVKDGITRFKKVFAD